MPRKPLARDKLLEAFSRIVLTDGERAATLDAVAAAAGVSKGGLLYHFPHRQALVGAMLVDLESLAADDFERLTASPRGAAREFLATSLYEDSALDRALVVASRLIQAGDDDARAAYARIEDNWLTAVLADVGDPVVATAVVCMGDGLYQQASMGLLPGSPEGKQRTLEHLMAALDRLTA